MTDKHSDTGAETGQWATIPLRYVCELNPSVRFEGFDEDTELTFLPMDRVKSGYFLPNTDKFSKYASSYNAFEEGDIVLAKVTPCFENGNIAIAQNLEGGKGFGSSELFVIRPKTVDRKFLFYYFQSSAFKQEGEASMTGAGGLKRVSPDLLRQHHLPCPDGETQRLIADYLDRETVRIDALVAEKEKMLALLEEKRAALISRAVTRGLDPTAPLKPSGLDWLGDIPKHWVTRRIRFLANFIGGSTPATKEAAFWEGGSVPWVSPKDMKTRLISDTEDHLTGEGLKNCASGLLQPGQVLIVVRSGILRHTLPVAINAVPVALNQDIRVFVLNDQVSPEYLAWFIEGKQKPLIEQWCKAVTTVESVEMEYLLDSFIPVPPMTEQVRIAESISRSSENINRIRESIKESTRLIKERRAALVTAAVTGQIPVEEMHP
jgi:type I restriction enzyme, S subunit